MKAARKLSIPQRREDVPGLAVRQIAGDLLDGILRRHQALDELLDSNRAFAALEDRDRALGRALTAVVLRRLGSLRYVLKLFLDRGTPPQAPRVETALLLGAAQIFFSTCPTTPPSIFRSGWRKPIRTPRTLPVWSMPCCGA